MAFECPKCKSVSHHPEDERHGYCAKCHDFTKPPVGGVPNAGDTHIFVDGIVAGRNKMPYVRITINGERAQLSIAETQKVTRDMLVMAARTEADAMVLTFFEKLGLPLASAAQIMQDFRIFRQENDDKPVSGTQVDPDSGLSV